MTDWGSWLVVADSLLEAGDERGELLVLEHRGEDVRARAEAWLANWSGYLIQGDAALVRWLIAFTPLFGHPVGPLLAQLELTDRWSDDVLPALTQQRAAVLAATRALIERAFDGVPVPDPAHRTIHQAEAADDHAFCDQSRDHLGRWQDLPDEHLFANQWALSHLDAQGIRYYVPAVMMLALRHLDEPHERDGWITESLGYTLQPSEGTLRDYQQQRFALFDRGQRTAIYAFALATSNERASTAWARVFEAECAAARDDWFAIYLGS